MKSPTPLEQRGDQPEPAPEAPRETRLAEPPLISLDSALLKDVNVSLKARLGDVTLSVQELLDLRAGSILQLETQLNGLVELRLNDAVVALGEIVAVGDHFGVRLVDVAPRS